MSNLNLLLDSLEKVKSVGGGKYIALCPVHSEKTPSFGVTDLMDGRILCHCFGCGANGIEVCERLGLDVAILFPEKIPSSKNGKPAFTKVRSGFSANQVLKCVQYELMIVSIFTEDLIEGVVPSKHDFERLQAAQRRIDEAISYGD